MIASIAAKDLAKQEAQKAHIARICSEATPELEKADPGRWALLQIELGDALSALQPQRLRTSQTNDYVVEKKTQSSWDSYSEALSKSSNLSPVERIRVLVSRGLLRRGEPESILDCQYATLGSVPQSDRRPDEILPMLGSRLWQIPDSATSDFHSLARAGLAENLIIFAENDKLRTGYPKTFSKGKQPYLVLITPSSPPARHNSLI